MCVVVSRLVLLFGVVVCLLLFMFFFASCSLLLVDWGLLLLVCSFIGVFLCC